MISPLLILKKNPKNKNLQKDKKKKKKAEKTND